MKGLYYDVREDLALLPEGAQFLVCYGGRATGKTYSALRYVIEDKKKFFFIKREIEDVKNICDGRTLRVETARQLTKPKNFNFTFKSKDKSPLAPLNRDFGWNVKPFLREKGFAECFNCDTLDHPYGESVGYIGALKLATKFKGFDLSDVDVIIFDEFCPTAGDIVWKGEGDKILDLVLTITRDRHLRGLKPVILMAFANADNVVCPLTNAIEVVDNLTEMQAKDQEYMYVEKRRAFLHKLKTSEERIAKDMELPIYQAMQGTKWFAKSLGNDFAYNDFSNVDHISMKNLKPEAKVIHNGRAHYVYLDAKTGYRYVTYTPTNVPTPIQYNLDSDAGKKAFYEYAMVVMRLDRGHFMATFETYALYYMYYDPRLV